MKAFHDNQSIKEKYLTRVRAHQAADHLIRGKGWDGTKGCAVGCTLEKYDHKAYEKELGIPEWLARVEDTLFEGMAEEKSRTWPEKFLEATPLGVDLEQIKVPFICILLEHTLQSMDAVKFDVDKFPDIAKAVVLSKSAVRDMIDAQQSGDQERISAAESATELARLAAWSATESAAAELAAELAWSAAWSASESGWSASESYDHYADELLKLLRGAK